MGDGADIVVNAPSEDAAKQAENARLKALVDLTDSMIQAGLLVTKQTAQFWETGLNYLYDNQLAGKARSEGWEKTNIQMNAIAPAVRQEIAIVSQRRPKVVAEPVSAEEKPKAEFWARELNWRLDHQVLKRNIHVKGLLDAKIGGLGVAKVYEEDRAWWDEKAHAWVREPRVSLLHPLSFGVDPNVETVEDAQFMFCRRRVPTQWAMDRWPDFKDDIKRAAGGKDGIEEMLGALSADSSGYKASTQRGTKPSDDLDGRLVEFLRASRGTLTKTSTGRAQDLTDDERASSVVITEIYFRDSKLRAAKEHVKYDGEELVEAGAVTAIPADPADPASRLVYVVADPDAREFANVKEKLTVGQPLNRYNWPELERDLGKEPVFPHGRVILRVNALILNPKEEDQVWQYRHWPFAVFVNMCLPHVWQGLSSVEMARGIQDWINIVAAKIVGWVLWFADNEAVVEEGALAGGKSALERLKARAGRIITLAKGRLKSYVRTAAAPLPEGLVHIYDKMMSKVQDALGMHDQDIGTASKADMTAFQVLTLQQSMKVGMGLQMASYDRWLLDIVERIAELDRENMAVGDMVRVAGAPDAARVEEFRDEYRDVQMDLKLSIGASLPHDKQMAKVEAMDLYKALSDPASMKNLLEAYEVPNVEAWLKENQQYQQFQQFMAAEQAAEEAAKSAGSPGNGALAAPRAGA
ncbi:MAG: hypothetical protein FD189_1100 [Elusimicrobia bacterium]|nr:MAG: hypothetical protein FD189_1100 [Elusimicrobiota bacterium]